MRKGKRHCVKIKDRKWFYVKRIEGNRFYLKSSGEGFMQKEKKETLHDA